MAQAKQDEAGGGVMSVGSVQPARVLVVRSANLRDRVAAALEAARLDARVEASPSYLSAMGWLTSERVDVVIGPVSAMTGMVGSTARALRRLAPGTRLIAVAGDGERAEAGAALSAGFDQCVYEPANATTLLSAMRLASAAPLMLSDEPGLGDQRGKPEAQGDHADTPGQLEDAQPEDAQPEDAQPEDALLDVAEPQPDNAQARGEQLAIDEGWLRLGFDQRSAVLPDGPVGDVDLAEAVMRGDGSLVPMAMKLLRDQSGMADAAFMAEQDANGLAVLSADVSFGGKLLGVLASGQGDAQVLGSWAAWLARWVALDRRQGGLYDLAMRDELTGLWNRRYFDRFLKELVKHAAQGRQQVTLLLFDIDNFKQYNDNFGHPAGDEILRSTAQLIQSLVREHDVVARIGGDEFGVVFWDKGEPRHLGSQHPDNVIGIATRFQKAIREHKFPKLGKDAVGQLTVSGGLAGFPWDGRNAEELIARADANAIQSKRQGKNAICFGPGAAPNGNGGH